MTPSEDMDSIDELFREREQYVEDRGFTSRVMKALPRRRYAWVSPLLLLSAAVVGCVLAVLWGPWGNLPAVGLADLLAPSSRVLVPWMFALGVAGALIWSAMAAVLRVEW